ncbi:MAG: hypothetical protein WA966_16060 [Ornithinimicrobium sp.]
MARTVQSRSRAALAGVAVLAGVAACGTDAEVAEVAQGTTSPDTPALAAAEPGDDVPATDLVQRLSSPGVEELTSFSFEVDLTDQQDQFAIDGAVDLAEGTPAAQLSADVPPLGTLDVRLVDGTAYVNVPELTPEGKYYEVPADELADLGMSDVSESLDLTSLMKDWDDDLTQVTFVGTEDVNGASTDHYAITVDPQAVLDAAGQTAPPDMELPDAGTYGIWVGEDNFVAKMVLDIDGASATVLLDDWGQDLQVQAPDAADVLEFPSF